MVVELSDKIKSLEGERLRNESITSTEITNLSIKIQSLTNENANYMKNIEQLSSTINSLKNEIYSGQDAYNKLEFNHEKLKNDFVSCIVQHFIREISFIVFVTRGLMPVH